MYSLVQTESRQWWYLQHDKQSLGSSACLKIDQDNPQVESRVLLSQSGLHRVLRLELLLGPDPESILGPKLEVVQKPKSIGRPTMFINGLGSR